MTQQERKFIDTLRSLEGGAGDRRLRKAPGWLTEDCLKKAAEPYDPKRRAGLERSASVGMAIESLRRAGVRVSLEPVKALIRTYEEWRQKLGQVRVLGCEYLQRDRCMHSSVRT
ncbi:hypothetical protein LDO32_11955 [Luteimonas sp. Y-2-2-4F]|nr:hypothetical protein [Luteimonas sp. Y-2-2-4F]MCD9032440.1 hypothetical protein [Luteimonas sp. Y-2-2-4F]